MKEELLHFIWQHRLFRKEGLRTVDGESVEVLTPGRPNEHDGPDFLGAQVRIGGVVWAGAVEVHLRSSDWYAHGHYEDPRYEAVVLHVVTEHDEEVRRSNGTVVPEVVLTWDETLTGRFEALMQSRSWVACAGDLHRLDPFVVRHALGRILVERLEYHAARILSDLEETSRDWEEVLYRHLARGFGLKANAQPFYLTARSLPLRYLARHRDNLLQVEALLFGQAGMLEERIFGDEYYERLKIEYRHLRKKFSLEPVAEHMWQRMRMRPSAFPAVRLAEFARFVHREENIFSHIIANPRLKELEPLFHVTADGYWEEHFDLNKPSKKQRKSFGKEAFYLVLINIVIPFYFIYGRINDLPAYRERALEMLEELPAERNAVVRRWAEAGITADNAFYSQALIHLKNEYCNRRRCLECPLGQRLLMRQGEM